jgi:hypothetical protein
MVGNALLPKNLAAERLKTKPIPLAGSGETFGWETFTLHEPKSGVTVVMATNSVSGCRGCPLSHPWGAVSEPPARIAGERRKSIHGSQLGTLSLRPLFARSEPW